MKTLVLKPNEVQPQWWVLDATDLVVGRMATKVAPMLIGKHRPDYTPHVACGDFVVIINAEKIKFSGRKWQQKIYDKYTGFPGGRRTITAEKLLEKSPEAIVRHAVRRMLPKNKLANRMINQLKIYTGSDHPHQAQQPKKLEM